MTMAKASSEWSREKKGSCKINLPDTLTHTHTQWKAMVRFFFSLSLLLFFFWLPLISSLAHFISSLCFALYVCVCVRFWYWLEQICNFQLVSNVSLTHHIYLNIFIKWMSYYHHHHHYHHDHQTNLWCLDILPPFKWWWWY